MKPHAGTALLLLLLCSLLLYPYGRAALQQEGLPAFSIRDESAIQVGLGEGFPLPGIHQFSDGTPLSGVIEMTGRSMADYQGPAFVSVQSLQAGAQIDLLPMAGGRFAIQTSWLPAGQRVALGIPLHPDRMSLLDWEFLPGVGSALAQAIETDRQINGDFVHLQSLQRVHGIGKSRIAKWQEFF